ncbi:uncharacterized protein PRCAT00000490001 [Priceomyces carsonii]|uniref:uncharacterized protein n=1 Tax=Priceomyces carsonii TaxID=28549 RepID=UPI002ED8B901|nr:unnamed protein product [Priceomyces carsonii]
MIDDADIHQLQSKNAVLKNNLKKLILESNDDYTDMDIMKQAMNDFDKENEDIGFRSKHMESLRKNIDAIKSTQYDLPSTASLKEVSQKIVSPTERETQKSKAENPKPKLTYSPPRVVDPLESSPKDNLLLNKVLYQKELILNLNQQLTSAKAESKKLKEKNGELVSINQELIRERDQEITRKEKSILRENEILREEFKHCHEKVRRLNQIISEKEHNLKLIDKLNKRQDVELEILKYELGAAVQLVENLRSVNSFTKLSFYDRFSSFRRQFFLLSEFIQNDFKAPPVLSECIEHRTLEENTTDLLLRDNTTKKLLGEPVKKVSPNIDSILMTSSFSENKAQKSFRAYIKAVQFIIRIQRDAKKRKLARQRIVNLHPVHRLQDR